MKDQAGLRAPLRQLSEAVQHSWTRRRQTYRLVSSNEETVATPSTSSFEDSQKYRWPHSLSLSFGVRLLYAFIVLVLVSIIARALFHSGNTSQTKLLQQQDHMLRLVLPSSEADNELCKTVLTAGIMGYTAPTVINYNVELDKPGKQSERDFQRLKMVHDYFSRHPHNRDDDIVVLLDSPYAWFQLRPEVILRRYYRIIDEANERLHQRVGKQAVVATGVRQSIVFAARNDCSGREASDPPCSAVPDSPDASIPNLKYLSSGTIVGPLGKMRLLFERVVSRAENTVGNVSLQTLFEDVFGEQEYQRELVRQKHSSFARKAWNSIKKMFEHEEAITDKIRERKGKEVEEGTSYEFGIVLDYGNELGLALGDTTDFRWVQWNSSSLLPADINSSMPPFWTPTGQNLPFETGWESVPLLVDKRTGAIPVVITLGWEQSSPLQRDGWSEMWMQANAKALFSEAISVPRLPVASVIDSNNGVEHIFWDSEVRFDRAGMQTIDGAWGSWKAMCEREETWRSLR